MCVSRLCLDDIKAESAYRAAHSRRKRMLDISKHIVRMASTYGRWMWLHKKYWALAQK